MGLVRFVPIIVVFMVDSSTLSLMLKLLSFAGIIFIFQLKKRFFFRTKLTYLDVIHQILDSSKTFLPTFFPENWR